MRERERTGGRRGGAGLASSGLGDDGETALVESRGSGASSYSIQSRGGERDVAGATGAVTGSGAGLWAGWIWTRGDG